MGLSKTLARLLVTAPSLFDPVPRILSATFAMPKVAPEAHSAICGDVKSAPGICFRLLYMSKVAPRVYALHDDMFKFHSRDHF